MHYSIIIILDVPILLLISRRTLQSGSIDIQFLWHQFIQRNNAIIECINLPFIKHICIAWISKCKFKHHFLIGSSYSRLSYFSNESILIRHLIALKSGTFNNASWSLIILALWIKYNEFTRNINLECSSWRQKMR